MIAAMLDCYGTLVRPPEINAAFTNSLKGSSESATCALAIFKKVRKDLTPKLKYRFCTQRERFQIIVLETLRQAKFQDKLASSILLNIMESFATSPVQPGVPNALRHLRSAGLIALVANGDTDVVRRVLDRLPDVFDVVVTSEQAKSYKPERRIFLRAASMLNCPASQIVMIGDDLKRDCIPAIELGMRSILIGSRTTSVPSGALLTVTSTEAMSLAYEILTTSIEKEL